MEIPPFLSVSAPVSPMASQGGRRSLDGRTELLTEESCNNIVQFGFATDPEEFICSTVVPGSNIVP